MERYDRTFVNGSVERLHQEDFCQALGVELRKKYQVKGGPSIQQVSALLRRHSSSPDEDVEAYRDALIFNWVIAGTDAHAKNYGVMLGNDGDIRLAPLYDLASGLPYAADDEAIQTLRLPQRIGRGYTLQRADRRSAWEATADALRMPAEDVIERAEQLAELIPAAFEKSVSALPAESQDGPTVTSLLRRLYRRSRTCSKVSTVTEADSV